jgi:excisionase family DNA binding protein
MTGPDGERDWPCGCCDEIAVYSELFRHVAKLLSVMFSENKGEIGRDPSHLETVHPHRERDKGGENVESTSERLLTPGEVAALFRVDPKTVTRWAAAGRISSIRTPGGHRRFRESEVHALLRGEEPAEAGVRGDLGR